MKHHQQKLQATRQLLEDMPFGKYVKVPKHQSGHFRKLFPLPFFAIIDGVPREIDITLKEFEELVPIVEREKEALQKSITGINWKLTDTTAPRQAATVYLVSGSKNHDLGEIVDKSPRS